VILNRAKVDVHELIAWGLDEYSYRNRAIGDRQEKFTQQIELARQRLAERECYTSGTTLIETENEAIASLLAVAAQRIDLLEEYEGLDWTLGIVDLRQVLAFQRRLVFSSTQGHSPVPPQDNWPQLISLTLGPRRGTEHRILCNNNEAGGLNVTLFSGNPDLQLRLNKAEHNDRLPLALHGGSPFLEIAELRGRWFLRDGYHRAFRLLQAGVYCVPAVVIRTRTLKELGATEPWFFGEGDLFSDRPPRIIDFIDDALVLRYERVALRKVIRICIEESLQPINEIEEVQGEQI
jgi:hypothetical protein